MRGADSVLMCRVGEECGLDGHRFDEITRALARPLGRRGFFRSVAGAVLGGTAVAKTAGDAGAACTTTCPPGQYLGAACRCLCLSTARPPLNGKCGCRAGETDCGDGTCKDLSSDPANCGGCSASCPDAEQVCRAGSCLCPADRPTFCPEIGCVDTQTDLDNCGECGNVCPGDTCNNPVCNAGVCGLVANPDAAGALCDDGNQCTTNDVCQPAVEGVSNCAGAPVQCRVPGLCEDNVTCNPATGECEPDYAASGTPCENPDRCLTGGACDGDGTCTGGTPTDCSAFTDQCNVGTCNPFNGTCFAQPTSGVACENPDLCLNGGACNSDGVCAGGTPVSCPACNACSGGTCAPTTDGQTGPGCTTTCCNGACCEAGSTCTGPSGSCAPPVVCGAVDQPCGTGCCTGLTCCGGTCRDTNTNPDFCGATCIDCPDPTNGSPICTDGVCSIQCESGFSPCGNACVLAGTCCTTCTGSEVCCSDVCSDTQTDSNNCGTCGNTCDVGEFCCQGGCDSLVCTRYILSSSTDPTSIIYVDDDLRVDLIQGSDTDTLLDDDDGVISELDPIEFTANQGDQLRIRAYDSGASQVLWPLYLHCASSSCFLPQHLTDGYTDNSGEADPGKFFGETFTINVQRAP